MIEIKRYDATRDRDRWDELVGRSSQGTLLHYRAYMDYHSDRFADCSLMALESDRPVALLPACLIDGELFSHAGLTYGGWLTEARHVTGNTMLDIIEAMCRWMEAEGINALHYKAVPHIYHRAPAQDDLYALWRHGATVEAMNLSAAVDVRAGERPPFNRGSVSSVHHARRAGVTVNRCDDWAAFWQILNELLDERYNARPVHSLDEITRLAAAFPHQITLLTATAPDGEMLGGTVLYLSPTVAHCQYIATSERGRQLRVLPLVMSEAYNMARSRGCRYLDYGTSNERGGTVLNASLLDQKARLGGRGVAYTTYRLSLTASPRPS